MIVDILGHIADALLHPLLVLVQQLLLVIQFFHLLAQHIQPVCHVPRVAPRTSASVRPAQWGSTHTTHAQPRKYQHATLHV